MNYYERHLGDYAKDTAHLSALEHGVYTLLLDRYYATEAPIPAAHVYRVAKAISKCERQAVDFVLGEFFKREGDDWRNGRADEEIEKARLRIATAQANGKRGGRPRRTKEEPAGNPVGYSRGTQEKALHTPDSIHQTVLQPSSPVPNLSASPARARGETREGGARDVPRETVEAIRVAYPPGLYRGADWLLAERAIRDRAAEGVDPAELLAAAQAYGAQQQALEKAGTQYVLKPSRFFGSDDWRGPFPLPAKPENAYDRIMRLNGGAPDNSTVIEHEPDIPGPSRLRLA